MDQVTKAGSIFNALVGPESRCKNPPKPSRRHMPRCATQVEPEPLPLSLGMGQKKGSQQNGSMCVPKPRYPKNSSKVTTGRLKLIPLKSLNPVTIFPTKIGLQTGPTPAGQAGSS
jgi:hypothetical protein